jgi:hypothetical protein
MGVESAKERFNETKQIIGDFNDARPERLAELGPG